MTIKINNEPTPEFEAQCLQIVRQWRNGGLPFDQAKSQLVHLGQVAQSDKQIANQARAYFTLGFLFALNGRHTDASIWQNNALRLFTMVNNPARIARCHLSLGESYRYRGDLNQAQQHYDQAYEFASQADDPLNQMFARGNAGHLAIERGNYDRARDLLTLTLHMLEEYMQQSPEDWAITPEEIYCEYGAALSQALLGLHDYAESWRYATDVYEIAQSKQYNLEGGFATRVLAHLLLLHPEYAAQWSQFEGQATADSLFQIACDLLKAADAQGDLATTQYDYARALEDNGRNADAAKQYHEAARLFTRLSMYNKARSASKAATRLARA